ncbi:MAG: hydrolase [Bdellovibrionales bacterium RIFCSPHIGHO2_01_FULL_40_29]|nr:MAG: hydrolase [Bdellovibrionales bacterium RIFCSPHIGHO2_01_FULL_40_29]OFZ35161.1 MAG: hydrolase [Bdellovibrionales bacterium RIFCSPHIGHO2_02_FULL_40_15]
MEIRDPIHGSIQLNDGEVAVIETVEFQRLREIKQLGFSEFSFPGATHNRFLHSIGVTFVAGQVFDSIFRAYPFTKNSTKNRFRQLVKLAALLHDIGHGPLSHTTEQVMPQLSQLKIKIYENQKIDQTRRANHEDYTVKFVTDSTVSDVIRENFTDILPEHVAYLIDKNLDCDESLFIEGGINFRPILCQIVSSELDADRMDYLERDSFFCGINYGKIDKDWLMQNLTLHIVNNSAYLALNRRALYAFDDFLISRHHMHLMVYFHHKSIIYEEMLNRYLSSPDCQFILPADSKEYINYTDYKLYEHLDTVDNEWAQRIAQRRPYRVALELHNQEKNRIDRISKLFSDKNIDVIHASSNVRLSKYHSTNPEESMNIFVVDQYDRWDVPSPVDSATQIFQKYEGERVIDRFYVAPEKYLEIKKMLTEVRY